MALRGSLRDYAKVFNKPRINRPAFLYFSAFLFVSFFPYSSLSYLIFFLVCFVIISLSVPANCILRFLSSLLSLFPA